MLVNERRGATHPPTRQTTSPTNHTMIIKALQALRDLACYGAMTWKWDPVISQIHTDYLHLLNQLLKECDK